jgi:hypothetical protein
MNITTPLPPEELYEANKHIIWGKFRVITIKSGGRRL